MEELFLSIHQAALKAQDGITGLARRLGKRQQTLINKLNPSDDTHQPNIGEFVAIIDDTGNTEPLEVLCAMFGGRFVTRSKARHENLLTAVLHADQEHGDIAKAIQAALADDGRIDAQELLAITREVQEARAAYTELENTLRELANNPTALKAVI